MSGRELVEVLDGTPVEQTQTRAAVVVAVDRWALTLATPATRRACRHAVLAFLAAHGMITAEAVAAWRDEQAAAGLSRATIRQRLAAVRAFAAWGQQTGHLDARQARELAAVQAPRLSVEHAPAAVGAEQLRLMDQAAGGVWPEDPLRVAQARVVLRVLGGCGLRVAELTTAELADVTPARPNATDRCLLTGRVVEDWQLRVHATRGRRRTVTVPASVQDAIQTYHRQLPEPARALVPALSGHAPGRPLPRAIAVRTAQAIIARLAEQANQAAGQQVISPTHAHPHALRHGYALRYLTHPKARLDGLQRALGHADIATTAKYLAAPPDELEVEPIDPWGRP